MLNLSSMKDTINYAKMTSVINYFLYNLVQSEKNQDQTKRTNSD